MPPILKLDRSQPAPVWLISLLAAVTAAGPFAMQAFLPALPAIAHSFAVTPGLAQLTLSLSYLAIALATLVYGPLSDRFGRRPVLFAGIWIFILGSLGSVLAPNLELLIVFRVVQAAGGAAGLVLARAIARDLYGPVQAARLIAQLTMVMVVAPMLGPVVGGVIIDLLHWRAIFAVTALVGLVILLSASRYLGESHQERGAMESPLALVQGFAELLRSPRFVLLGLYPALAGMIFFAFIAGAPYVMVNLLQRPATEYGLYFMLIAGGFMFGNFITVHLAERVGLLPMMILGMLLAVAGVLLCGLFLALDRLSPLTLFLPIVLAQIGQGLGMPNAQAAAINEMPSRAGTASALSGFVQMLVAALVSQAAGMLVVGSAWPLVGLMLLGALSALSAALLVVALDARKPAGPASPPAVPPPY